MADLYARIVLRLIGPALALREKRHVTSMAPQICALAAARQASTAAEAATLAASVRLSDRGTSQ